MLVCRITISDSFELIGCQSVALAPGKSARNLRSQSVYIKRDRMRDLPDKRPTNCVIRKFRDCETHHVPYKKLTPSVKQIVVSRIFHCNAML